MCGTGTSITAVCCTGITAVCCTGITAVCCTGVTAGITGTSMYEHNNTALSFTITLVE